MGRKAVAFAITALWLGAAAAEAQMQPPTGAAANCPITRDQLATALKAAVKPSGGPSNGGLDNNEWGAVVNRDGNVCAVAFSGGTWKDQWLGSRPIKAPVPGMDRTLRRGPTHSGARPRREKSGPSPSR